MADDSLRESASRADSTASSQEVGTSTSRSCHTDPRKSDQEGDACGCAIRNDVPDDADACGATSPNDLRCTKPPGHDGQHAACSLSQHPIEAWERYD
jgi:hypothetical protein